jgi:hypothetical protein
MAVVIGFGGGGPFLGGTADVTANTTLTTDYNWLTVGPTTISSGITVTVNSGVTWVIV